MQDKERDETLAEWSVVLFFVHAFLITFLNELRFGKYLNWDDRLLQSHDITTEVWRSDNLPLHVVVK